MADYDYDLFVIGAGSGGVRASRMAAATGARVAVCEDRYLGGTCVNVGCVPKKLLVYGSRYGGAIREAAGYGWSVGEVRFDWKHLIDAKDQEIERLNGIYGRLLEGAGVRILEGRGALVGPHTVRVGDRTWTARHILIATGGWPWVPKVPGAEHGITSNEMFYLPRQPGRMVVVGGGYIAVEFASLMRGFGTEVHLIYRGKQILRGFDDDVRRVLTDGLCEHGVDVRCEANVTAIERQGDHLEVTLTDGTDLQADQLLWATGRLPNTAGLGLEEVGVDTDAVGRIVVDDRFRTSIPSVYALGDVANTLNLTPVALEEAMILVRNLFGGADDIMDYANVPTAVFTTPELASVGLTEEDARALGEEVDVYRSNFRPLRHTVSGLSERTFMKLVVDTRTQRVLGCHMVGEDAAEIIQGLAVALKCGATKAQLDATVGIHPTVAEELVTMRTKSQ